MRRSGFERSECRLACAGIAVALLASACSGSPAPPDEALGMRVGTGLFDLQEFEEVESKLGTPLHFTVQFTGRKSQKDMNGSAFGLLAADGAGLPVIADRITLSITVPLGFGQANARTAEGRAAIGENLEDVAAGTFDAAYQRVAMRLIEGGYPDAIIRLGHEFNGAWSPWSSRHNEEAYIAAYRHVHQIFREQSEDFQFDWTAMRAGWEEWAVDAYPGDDYVDIFGLDVYWKVQEGDISWSTDVWERDFLPVLRSHRVLAESRGKAVSYPEWGLSGADNPAFVEAMYEWLASVPEDGAGGLHYHSYFNTGEEYSLENFPNSEAAYLRLFGS
jgi:hypothetical protein